MSRNEREIQERRFAHEVCAKLDAAAQDLPADISARLAASRRMALAHKKAEAPVRQPVFAPAGLPHGAHHGPVFEDEDTPLNRVGAWLRRLGLVGTVVLLSAGLFGIYHWQQQKRIEELADVDAAMLLDDLPPAAYADQGFHVFLKHGE